MVILNLIVEKLGILSAHLCQKTSHALHFRVEGKKTTPVIVGLSIADIPLSYRTESSAVTNVGVELSDTFPLNSTSPVFDYIIPFIAKTALTGGVDTITISSHEYKFT